MDNWRGLGAVVDGMRAHGFAFNLSTVDRTTWRATFARHPLFAADGFGAGDIPWRSVQLAAAAALKRSAPGQ